MLCSYDMSAKTKSLRSRTGLFKSSTAAQALSFASIFFLQIFAIMSDFHEQA